MTPVSVLRTHLPNARRILEILPTAAVWLIITAPVWAAILAPAALGFGLVIFSIYWLWKSFGFASGVLIGFWRLHNAQQRDWIAESLALPGYEKLHHLVIVPTFGESEEIVRLISAKKKEPEWMLEWRLRAYRHWLTMSEPTWANVHYDPIDYQAIRYYSAPIRPGDDSRNRSE